MHDSENEIWRFSTPRIVVTCEVGPEEMAPEDSFCCDDDIAFAKSGKPSAWFCATVRVWVRPDPDACERCAGDPPGEEIGWDGLGGCSYRSFTDFLGGRVGYRRRKSSIEPGGYFPDMVREAVRMARATIGRHADLGLRKAAA